MEFLCAANGKSIGWFQIRLTPSGMPSRIPTHLYYEVAPAMRGQGFGSEIFRISKFLGILEIGPEFLVSAQKDSLSERIIKSQGGIEVHSEKGLNYFRFRVLPKSSTQQNARVGDFV